jgi:hypothetical protein
MRSAMRLVLGGRRRPNLPKTRLGFARVRAGTGSMKVALVGNSTTRGVCAGGLTTPHGLVAQSYPSALATALAAAGLPSRTDSLWGPGSSISGTNGTMADLVTNDPRVTSGAGWVVNNAVSSMGGDLIQNATTTNALSFNPGTTFDTIEITYIRNSTADRFTVDIGAGTIYTSPGSGTVAILQATISCTRGANTLNIKCLRDASTSLFLVSIRCYDSTIPKVELFNMGCNGVKAAYWTTTGAPAVTPWATLSALEFIAPDLTIIDTGINDWNTGPTSISTYRSNVQAVITGAKLSGDVLLLGPNPTNTNGTGTPAVQATFLAALRDLAAINNVPYLDIPTLFTSYDIANASGWMGDTTHPNTVGYNIIGQAVAKVLLAA